MRIKIIISICVVFLSGCIELYNPEGVEEISDLLVIEGTITDNESVFVLRRSVGLSETLTGTETVDDAIVYVEKDNGEQLPGIFQKNGKYSVQTGELNAEMKYRLYVKIGEDEYRSNFLSPLYTAEIDSITYSKEGKEEPVNFYLYTHDPDDGSKYFRWSFDEIWEVHANLFANYGYLTNEPEYFYLHTPQNIHYCWGRDHSKSILLESTNSLSENVIYQKKINEIQPRSDKLSVLYYLLVKQNQIRKEAYDYLYNLQKNVEQSGSLFAPIPSEVIGNVKCLTNDLPVIGYIEVSKTTMKEVFLPNETLQYYEPTEGLCVDVNEYDSYFAHHILYTYLFVEPGFPTQYAPIRCVDCRRKEKASKDRPDFWPNTHY